MLKLKCIKQIYLIKMIVLFHLTIMTYFMISTIEDPTADDVYMVWLHTMVYISA